MSEADAKAASVVDEIDGLLSTGTTASEVMSLQRSIAKKRLLPPTASSQEKRLEMINGIISHIDEGLSAPFPKPPSVDELFHD